MGMLLRYLYEVRDAAEYFDDSLSQRKLAPSGRQVDGDRAGRLGTGSRSRTATERVMDSFS